MTPLLVSGSAKALPETCPTLLDYRAGGTVLDRLIRPYVAAIGDLALDGADSAVARALARTWADLKTRVESAAGSADCRVLVKHYPRGDLPGRCVGIHVSFYTVADPHLDPEPYRERVYRSDLPPLDGVLFEFHKTYQLDPAPRLIAAWIEVQEEIRVGQPRQPVGVILGGNVGEVGRDPQSIQHFESLGGGTRSGLAWFDRSAGVGAPDPWGCTFTREGTAIRVRPLEPALEASLRAAVNRA